MISTIKDTVFKSTNFKIIITLLLDGDEKYKKNDFYSAFKNKKGTTSINMDSVSRSIISFNSYTFEDGKYQVSNGINLSTRTYHDILCALTLCEEWLKSKKYKYLFTIIDNKLRGLGSLPPYCPIVYRNNVDFLRFVPAVVKDHSGNLCEGIGLKTDKNPIVQLTADEFLNMSLILKSYINNVYSSNLQLYNAAVLSNIYNRIRHKST